jgi:hypothetical protein
MIYLNLSLARLKQESSMLLEMMDRIALRVEKIPIKGYRMDSNPGYKFSNEFDIRCLNNQLVVTWYSINYMYKIRNVTK